MITAPSSVTKEFATSSAGRVEQELFGALSVLEDILENSVKYGPSSDLQSRYRSVRSWFMTHYRQVNTSLNTGNFKGGSIATWSLEAGSAHSLYRLLTSCSLNDSDFHSQDWRRILARCRADAAAKAEVR
jgi:hypothetical protein